MSFIQNTKYQVTNCHRVSIPEDHGEISQLKQPTVIESSMDKYTPHFEKSVMCESLGWSYCTHTDHSNRHGDTLDGKVYRFHLSLGS